jgi:hypothetical protein
MGRMNAGLGARFAPVFRPVDRRREPPRAEERELDRPRDALRAPLRLDEPRLALDRFFLVAIDDLS